MSNLISKSEKFFGSNTVKAFASAIVFIFTLGVFYEKWQQKMNDMPKQIASELIKQISGVDKKLDEHLIFDKAEKQAISEKIQDTKDRLRDLEHKQAGYAQKEFIRPANTEVPEPSVTDLRRKR